MTENSPRDERSRVISISDDSMMISGPTAMTMILALLLLRILAATISEIFPDIRHDARRPKVTAVVTLAVSVSLYPNHSLNSGISTVIAWMTKVVDMKPIISSHTTCLLYKSRCV